MFDKPTYIRYRYILKSWKKIKNILIYKKLKNKYYEEREKETCQQYKQEI